MGELIQTYGSTFVDGFKITIYSSILALLFSLIIGTLMAIFQLSKNKLISGLAKAYVEFFRNIPLLIIVMFSMSLFHSIGSALTDSRQERSV